MSKIDDEILKLSKDELLSLFEMMRMKNTRFEKDLYDVLTLIRANKRAQGGRG
jgi:hypothetical protein